MIKLRAAYVYSRQSQHRHARSLLATDGMRHMHTAADARFDQTSEQFAEDARTTR